MNENDFIENYFAGALSADEIKLFDTKIQDDPVFAEEVAFYCNAMAAIKSQVAEEKKQRFRELYRQADEETKVRPLRRLWPYMSAAAIIAAIVVGLFIFTQPSSSKLADQYIEQNFKTLSVNMGTKKDEMQKGLQLYRENKLSLALQQFEKILHADTSDFVALKNAGIVCLRLNQYDKALGYFQQLATKPGYNSNPGLLYEAITLFKRDAAGDKKEARELLQQVIAQGLEGKDDAQQLLR